MELASIFNSVNKIGKHREECFSPSMCADERPNPSRVSGKLLETREIKVVTEISAGPCLLVDGVGAGAPCDDGRNGFGIPMEELLEAGLSLRPTHQLAILQRLLRAEQRRGGGDLRLRPHRMRRDRDSKAGSADAANGLA